MREQFVHVAVVSARHASEDGGSGHFDVLLEDGEYKIFDGGAGMYVCTCTSRVRAETKAQELADAYDARLDNARQAQLHARALIAFHKIDAMAEAAIQAELDLAPLGDGELCPLRAITDICVRARNKIGEMHT